MTTGNQRLAAADILAKAKAKIARCRLVLDGELLDQHVQLEEALGKAEPDSAAAKAIAEQIVAVEDALADAEVEFMYRGMGRGPWRKLMADHPPTDEQRAQGAEFDVDTFPAAAMAACLDAPRMSVEEVAQLLDGCDETQFATLWGACLKANLGGQVNRPESQAAHALLANGRPKSAPPSDSELAEAS